MSAVAALIRYVQGITSGVPGQALLGVTGVAVTANNNNDTGVATWSWSVISSPPGSAIVPNTILATTPTLTFTPDLPGGYDIKLTVTDGGANTSIDSRVFGVNQPSGRFIPPFSGDAGSLNFEGTPFGWDPIMRVWLLLLDSLANGSFASAVVVNGGTTTAVSPQVGWYLGDTTLGNGTAVVTLSPGTYPGEAHTFQVAKGVGRIVVNSAGGVANMVDPNQGQNVNSFVVSGLGSAKQFAWNQALSLWL